MSIFSLNGGGSLFLSFSIRSYCACVCVAGRGSPDVFRERERAEGHKPQLTCVVLLPRCRACTSTSPSSSLTWGAEGWWWAMTPELRRPVVAPVNGTHPPLLPLLSA